jgi:prepilin-type N-terminal cleavage/methylation domain-containing protein
LSADAGSRSCDPNGVAAVPSGFTLIELVAVLLLMGILAATAASRLVSGNAFAPALISQQIVAVGRLAQQTAQSRRDAVVSLDVDQNGNDWRVRVVVDDGTTTVVADEERTQLRNAGVGVTNGGAPVFLGPTTTLHVVFDGMGGLAGGTVGSTPLSPMVGIGLTAVGDSTANVCIGTTGHVYRGACI